MQYFLKNRQKRENNTLKTTKSNNKIKFVKPLYGIYNHKIILKETNRQLTPLISPV